MVYWYSKDLEDDDILISTTQSFLVKAAVTRDNQA